MADSRRTAFRARLAYRFDETMSAGAIALVAYVGIAAFGLVAAGALLYWLLGVDAEGGVAEQLWLSLGRAIDAGTFTGDSTWTMRLVSIAITLAGIFLVSALIGLIATALDQRLTELRKGRSKVVERDHVLVLGWAPTLPAILAELAVANENQRDACVVVMAREDKVAMEDALRDRLPDGNPTRLVCRTGDPSDPRDLAIASPLEARSVIVLAEPGDSPDAQVVKVVLSLMSFDRELERISVTAELVDARHAEALSEATGGAVRTVVSSDLIARVTAQVCHQSGLSAVVQELLDFDGDEIYFRPEPALVGRTVAEARLAYRDATVIGLRHAGGRVELNPPSDARIAGDSQLVAIAEDDDRFTLAAPSRDVSAAPPRPAPLDPTPVRALVLGWNTLGPAILEELDRVAGPGSCVRILADPDLVEPSVMDDVQQLRRIETAIELADTTDGEALRVALADGVWDRIVLLCYRTGLAPEAADARTLLTLLQVRRLLGQPGHPNATASIVTELLDVRAVRLASVATPDDFVVSERLTSLLLAQLAENAELDGVFDELFGAGGVDIWLRPAAAYVGGGGTFGDAIVAAGAIRETAIGFRPGARGAAPRLNPRKDEPLGPGDELIVLASAHGSEGELSVAA
jgi:hypothetical protein